MTDQPQPDWADAIALELPEAVYRDVRAKIDAERAALQLEREARLEDAAQRETALQHARNILSRAEAAEERALNAESIAKHAIKRAEKAERERDEARDDKAHLNTCINGLREREEAAERRVEEAEARAAHYAKECDSLSALLDQCAEALERLVDHLCDGGEWELGATWEEPIAMARAALAAIREMRERGQKEVMPDRKRPEEDRSGSQPEHVTPGAAHPINAEHPASSGERADLVRRLREAADDAGCQIGRAWNLMDEAADALESPLPERVQAVIRERDKFRGVALQAEVVLRVNMDEIEKRWGSRLVSLRGLHKQIVAALDSATGTPT